jgi:hypothetical protein
MQPFACRKGRRFGEQAMGPPPLMISASVATVSVPNPEALLVVLVYQVRQAHRSFSGRVICGATGDFLRNSRGNRKADSINNGNGQQHGFLRKEYPYAALQR